MEWLDILRAKRDELGSAAAVGELIGYKGSSVRLALLGKYPGRTEKMAAAVMAKLAGRTACPHLGADIAPTACADYANRPMPQSDPAALKHWRACRKCPHHPGAAS